MRPASFDADIVEHAFVLPPLGFDADMKIEKHLRIEELLEILARRDADPLDHLAAPADDDRLLRLTLDDDGAVQFQRTVLPFRLLEPVDHHRARERNLGMCELKQLLPHDL